MAHKRNKKRATSSQRLRRPTSHRLRRGPATDASIKQSSTSNQGPISEAIDQQLGSDKPTSGKRKSGKRTSGKPTSRKPTSGKSEPRKTSSTKTEPRKTSSTKTEPRKSKSIESKSIGLESRQSKPIASKPIKLESLTTLVVREARQEDSSPVSKFVTPRSTSQEPSPEQDEFARRLNEKTLAPWNQALEEKRAAAKYRQEAPQRFRRRLRIAALSLVVVFAFYACSVLLGWLSGGHTLPGRRVTHSQLTSTELRNRFALSPETMLCSDYQRAAQQADAAMRQEIRRRQNIDFKQAARHQRPRASWHSRVEKMRKMHAVGIQGQSLLNQDAQQRLEHIIQDRPR